MSQVARMAGPGLSGFTQSGGYPTFFCAEGYTQSGGDPTI
jgi:hypothetical protein